MITIKANAEQRENLQILLDKVFPIMLAKGEEDAFLEAYVDNCGTPMCIAGEACVLKEFNDKGLGFLVSDRIEDRQPMLNGSVKGSSLDKFFGRGAYDALFDVNGNHHSDYQEVLTRQANLKEFLECSH